MKIPSNKIVDVIRYFRDELKNSYETNELETMMAHCFEKFININRSELTLRQNETLTESELLKFNFAIKDLKLQKPIQYILGTADFYGMKFIVNKNVLIPRPETEELVDLIIKEYQISRVEFHDQEIDIIDIGGGSGCIAIALKKNIRAANVTCLDISEQALEVATQNAKLNYVEINFLPDNILQPAFDFRLTTYDFIVSNPPYVCISEKHGMQKNVLDYEPHLALFVEDNNPLKFYTAITDFAIGHLKPRGKLYFEINQAHGEEVKLLMEQKGFKNVVLKKDFNNKNRILRGNI